jgi:hypothetical protein
VPCYGQVPQHRRGALPQVPALFHQRVHAARAVAKNRSRQRVRFTIMNCVGNHLSLFLQRIYSENSPQNCNATRSARCARQTAFAASHYPLPTAGLFRTRHRSNMQCENGNFKVFGAAALNTSFRIDIWNERSISKGARAVWSVAGECRWSGRQRRCRGSPSECDRRGRARNLWRRAREARRR